MMLTWALSYSCNHSDQIRSNPAPERLLEAPPCFRRHSQRLVKDWSPQCDIMMHFCVSFVKQLQPRRRSLQPADEQEARSSDLV